MVNHNYGIKSDNFNMNYKQSWNDGTLSRNSKIKSQNNEIKSHKYDKIKHFIIRTVNFNLYHKYDLVSQF